MKKKQAVYLFLMLLFCAGATQSCTVVIREGKVGVKRTFGKYKDKPYTKGLKVYNPFRSTIIRVSTKTENLKVNLTIPSKEGLSLESEVSILYHVRPESTPEILRTIGKSYEKKIILPVFRSAVSDVSARFFAKDMHTKERSNIEKVIRDEMMKYLDEKGIEVEAVLLKRIKLPTSLSNAIEQKLEAEQEVQQMEFTLQKARKEAERKQIQLEQEVKQMEFRIQKTEKEAERLKIEAAGIRDAQKIVGESLNKNILQFKSIEAFLELAKSPNAKVIVSDGDLPMIMDPKPE